MFKTFRSPAPKVQLLHAALCIIWNIAGLWLLSNDLQPIGPTASMAAIGLIIVFSATLILGERNNQPVLYLLASGLLALAAVSAIFGGFTLVKSLCPLEID